MSSERRDAIVAFALSLLLAVALTWPMAARLGSAGRVDSGDGRHGVWNVSWVAHALTTSPTHLFDANIFYPHDNALAFSEANLVAGVLAVPAWLITGGNPYAAYNSVVLLAFAMAALAAYFLARTVGASRFGATIAALVYGYSPYMLAHIPHIQLLMTFGPALSLAVMHRFVTTPTTGRAVALGLTLSVTGLACAYYGIFSGLVVSLGILWFAAVDGHWRQWQYWARAVLAAVIVLIVILPFFLPYLSVREEGFARSLDEARLFSTIGRAYLASAVHVHQWMLALLGSWKEVLFPGFQAIVLSIVAIVITARHRTRPQVRVVGYYVVMMVFAFWISLGPDAGLYTLLYHTLPAFSFLRAPARMGIMVTLGVALLSALALTWWRPGSPARQRVFVAVMVLIALVESWAGPLQLQTATPVNKVYRHLAILPEAPVAEFPFYHGAEERHRQTEYMLMSTFHWKPLLNGYSDHFPTDYLMDKPVLTTFPSQDAVAILQDRGVRWVVVHFNRYPADYARKLRPLMRTMGRQLRVVIDDTEVGLYEVIFPMRPAALPLP
jgi:hypothetical protein